MGQQFVLRKMFSGDNRKISEIVVDCLRLPSDEIKQFNSMYGKCVQDRYKYNYLLNLCRKFFLGLLLKKINEVTKDAEPSIGRRPYFSELMADKLTFKDTARIAGEGRNLTNLSVTESLTSLDEIKRDKTSKGLHTPER
jgi:hypothetical protein